MKNILNQKVTLRQLFKEGGAAEEVDQWSLDYFKKEGYIEDPKITSEEQLLKLIEEGIQPAMNEFTKRKKLPHIKTSISTGRQDRKYLDAESAPITGKELGIFANPFESAHLGLFSGREISFSQKGSRFFFKPFIWSTMHIGWKHKGGGTNGSSYFIDEYDGRGEDSIYYVISEKKIYTKVEYLKKLGKI